MNNVIRDSPGDYSDLFICAESYITLCLLGNFSVLHLSSADFFFKINFFEIDPRVSNSLDPEEARHCVQTVCEGYQQTTLVDKELILHDRLPFGLAI